MNIKLDENMPAGLAPILSGLGHNVETVVQEGMEGWTDPDIWERVQQETRFLITQDLDFSDVRRFAPGTHQGILLVLSELTRKGLIKINRFKGAKKKTNYLYKLTPYGLEEKACVTASFLRQKQQEYEEIKRQKKHQKH